MREFSNPADFVARASPFLEEHEAENTLILGLALAQRAAGAEPKAGSFLATIEDSGQVIAAAMRTPPHRLIVTRAPAMAIAILADHIARHRHELPGIIGAVESASLFVTAWSKLSRQTISPGKSLRIHQLDRVIPPPNPGGAFTEATRADLDLLLEWTAAFTADIGDRISWDQRAFVESALAEHRIFLWRDQGPVSMAACAHPTPNGIRINLVYTPPYLRKRGYASAVVATLSQRLLASGRRFCFLFTDLANPTSNSIYRKIGYHGVCDFREYLFT